MTKLVLPGLPALLSEAADAAHTFVAAARAPVRAMIVGEEGRIDRRLADIEQHAVHGFGWYASYAEMLREVAAWAATLDAEGQFSEIEALLAQLLFAEYGAHLRGGIAMNQGETIRPADLGGDASALENAALGLLIREGGTQAVKTAIARHLAEARGKATLENDGLDETLNMVRDQFFAFSRDRIMPHAHQ